MYQLHATTTTAAGRGRHYPVRLPPMEHAWAGMRATIFGGYEKRTTTRRRPSSCPLPQCPLRAAPAHQSALGRRRRRRSLGWGDGAVRLGLDRDLPRSQRTRRRRAARAGRFLGVVRGMEPEGFARTYMLGFCMELGAVCGREESAVDRWYHHLLVFLLVFLLSLHAHSLWLLKCTHTDSRRAVSGAAATNRGSEHLAVATGRHPGGP